MESVLLEDVRLRKEYGVNYTYQSNPPLYPGCQHAGSVFRDCNERTAPVSASSGKQDDKIKTCKITILIIPRCDREIMDTFRVNSESKKWDANYHPWDVLKSLFSQRTKIPSAVQSGFNRILLHNYVQILNIYCL